MVKKPLVLANNPLFSGPKLQDRERVGIPYREIELALIDRDPNQPRVNFDEEKLNELADSIKMYGILSPLLVRPSKTAGRYTLIAGERRFRAANKIGVKSVPALVDQGQETTGERTLAMQLVENLQRADLSPLERAHAIGALKDSFNLSVRDVAERLGISKSMVQRSLEILDLPDDLLNALREGASESKILLLAKIEDEEIRASYLKELDVLTRKQLEKNIEKSDGEDNKKIELSAEDQRIVDEMQRGLGLKVKMVKNSPELDKGKIIIEFYSQSDLQELCRKLASDNEAVAV
jgi:ParB family chromosome partitioning protein